MRFSEESELMFRRQPECTRLGDRFIYGESLLPGDPWDLPENLVRHAIDPRSRPIHLSEQHHFFYSVFDRRGLLMRMSMDMMLSGRSRHSLYRSHVTDPGGIEYLWVLDALTQFYVPKSGKTKREPQRCIWLWRVPRSACRDGSQPCPAQTGAVRIFIGNSGKAGR